MPLTTDPKRANFTISGADYEPTDTTWSFASESEKRAYWKRLGELAVEAKRWELRRGIDVNGRRFAPVRPASRTDGAAGPALSPHQAESRFQRLLRMVGTAQQCTLFWSHGWARYVKYHAYRMGPRTLPVRDAVGLSPGRQRWVREGARLWWSNRHRLIPGGRVG